MEEDAREEAAGLGSANTWGETVASSKELDLGIWVGLDLVACLGGDNLDTDET